MTAVKYYTSIGGTVNEACMHYNNILVHFKVEWESYEKLVNGDEPKMPKVNDREAERKIILWALSLKTTSPPATEQRDP